MVNDGMCGCGPSFWLIFKLFVGRLSSEVPLNGRHLVGGQSGEHSLGFGYCF